MPLSWKEKRERAINFSREWADAKYEKGESQTFYNEFFDIFGVTRRRVATFEEPVKKLGNKRGYIDLFWKGLLLVEQKSKGGNLIKAKSQAYDYFPGIKEGELPKYVLVSDFQNFILKNLDEDFEITFPLSELSQNIHEFGFIDGSQKKIFRDQDPVNIQASELVGKLYESLQESGYSGKDLEKFLTRLVFCLFADDTSIFDRDSFYFLIEYKAKIDGTDTGDLIAKLFQVLDTPLDQREKKLDEDFVNFPFINGDLFKDPIKIPSFDSKMREQLINVCLFDWSEISPAIFGSLFQSVMDREQRRKQGAHYTSEQNILKVIEPLFLNSFWDKFDKIKNLTGNRRRSELIKFQQSLSDINFLDPACGCGNFLVIAYREMRKLELSILDEIKVTKDNFAQLEIDAKTLSVIDVNQFYGIEIGEFPCRIAEISLWMISHLMNEELGKKFGTTYLRNPFKKSPQIIHNDALEIDWEDLIPSEKCSYILGNPPFIGSQFQSPKQKLQIRQIANLGKSGGTLDYVAGWFIKAVRYLKNNSQIGFVATNSITAGEQVAQLWEIIFQYDISISFAHKTFNWLSEAKSSASVHVVILGLSKTVYAPRNKLIYEYFDNSNKPIESKYKEVSPYLIDSSKLKNPKLFVKKVSKPINKLPKLSSGSQPIDNGNYIFKSEEKDQFISQEPLSKEWIKPYLGGKEFINGGIRWILLAQEIPPSSLSKLPLVKERIAAVRNYRLKSKRKSTQKLAETPTRFQVNVIPKNPFLVIPENSSSTREYLPIAWVNPPTVPSNKLRIIENAEKHSFAILVSAMHMSWVRHIGGRIKSDYQYSIGIVYNNFPLINLDSNQISKLEKSANNILKEREKDPEACLADLYGPDSMSAMLKKAHIENDRLVDKLYRKSPFKSDLERAEYLLNLFENQK